MIENSWSKVSKTAAGDGPGGRGGLSQATEVMEKTADGQPLYFCVIDRLSYGSLDTALVHVKMQHGMALHGELLLRMRMIGGGR